VNLLTYRYVTCSISLFTLLQCFLTVGWVFFSLLAGFCNVRAFSWEKSLASKIPKRFFFWRPTL